MWLFVSYIVLLQSAPMRPLLLPAAPTAATPQACKATAAMQHAAQALHPHPQREHHSSRARALEPGVEQRAAASGVRVHCMINSARVEDWALWLLGAELDTGFWAAVGQLEGTRGA